MPKQRDIDCPECGAKMLLKWSDRYNRYFYGCSSWPKCKCCHGANRDGSPLGFPADKETRQLRMQVHAALDVIWPWSDKQAVSEMYRYLEANTTSGHMGKMSKEELKDLLRRIDIGEIKREE